MFCPVCPVCPVCCFTVVFHGSCLALQSPCWGRKICFFVCLFVCFFCFCFCFVLVYYLCTICHLLCIPSVCVISRLLYMIVVLPGHQPYCFNPVVLLLAIQKWYGCCSSLYVRIIFEEVLFSTFFHAIKTLSTSFWRAMLCERSPPTYVILFLDL